MGDSVTDGSVSENVVDSVEENIEDSEIKVSVVGVSVCDVGVSAVANLSVARGVVGGNCVFRVSVVKASVGDARDSTTVGVWQSTPEKPFGQTQPSSPVLSSR